MDRRCLAQANVGMAGYSNYREPTFLGAWAELGVVAVEMEMAPHLLLSHLHGKKAAGLYVISDHPLRGDEIWRRGVLRDQALLGAYGQAVEIVLGAIVTLAES